MTKELRLKIKQEYKKELERKRIKSGFYQKLTAYLLIVLMVGFSLATWYQNKLYDELIGEAQIIKQDLAKTSSQGQILPNSALVEPTTKELIEIMAKEYNVCVETALKIAECESQYGKYNYNWQGSSAKGVYQFIDKTFANYCDGDVMNEKDNIKCFMKLYNKFSHWWEQCNIIINK